MTTGTIGAPLPTTAREPIRIRMYNVGFGDSFLLHLPTSGGTKRMLIDCGFHSQGKGKFSDKELVTRIKEDLKGEALDVVVATHRHQDHISGFGETELWAGVGVREVWLPFTAADAGDESRGLTDWNCLMATASQFVGNDGKLTQIAISALSARPGTLDAVAWMLWNARENAPGIANLRRGMKAPGGRPALRRYLPKGDKLPMRLNTPVLPDVTVHVLGPPRDEASRRKRKAPGGWGVVDPQGGGAVAAGGVREPRPFSEEWRVPSGQFPSRLPFTPKSLEHIARFNDDLAAVAAALDGFLNGESLVLLIELGEARLLFPGDAEVGSWKAILESPECHLLASNATFLKFGHHGSHNATPLVFLENELAADAVAMMSTQEGPGNYRNNIPRPQILDTVKTRGMPFARADRPQDVGESSVFKVDPGERWIDCELPC